MVVCSEIDPTFSPTRREQMAHERISRCVHFRGRENTVQVRDDGGKLVITGRVPSYYLKQVLQTVLRDIDGVSDIDNRVDVLWPTTDEHKNDTR